MSGILGVWNLDGRPVEKALLAELSATLAHRGPDGDNIWIEGPIGLACQLLRVTPEAAAETQPLVHPSGAVLVFDGRLDNREELLANLKGLPEVSTRCPDPVLVLAAYEAFGDRLPEWLAGDFALGLFDPVRQHLLLARDAIGVRPLYYCRTGDIVVFASEIKAILAHPTVAPRPNDDVVAQYVLGRDQETRGRTFFDGVSSLLPAHTAIITPRRLVTRRYWDFDASRRIRLGSFEDYAEAFRDHFERAVRRRLRSAHPVAVSLSGGLDSSSIFCLSQTLARQSPGRHPAVLGFSYVSPAGSPSDEAAYLTEIEQKYGVTVGRIPMSSMGPLNTSGDTVWRMELPWLDEMWNTTQAFLSTMNRHGARVLLTGHWADQLLFDQAYLVDLAYQLSWGEIRAHLREFGRWFTDADARFYPRRFLIDTVKYSLPGPALSLLRSFRLKQGRGWYTGALRRRARRRGSSALPPVRAFPTAHARALYEQARSSRQVLCMEWNNKMASTHGLEMAFPFLDRDLISFLMRTPGEMQTWKGVPKVLLREGLRGVLPEAIAGRNWKADFTHLLNDGMQREHTLMADWLRSHTMAISHGYVDRDAMNRELDRVKRCLRGPSADTAWSLSDLLGLELWLQVFFAENNNGEERLRSPEARPRATA